MKLPLISAHCRALSFSLSRETPSVAGWDIGTGKKLDKSAEAFHYSGMNDIISTWSIEIYTDDQGNAPFEEWLFSLDTSLQLRVIARLDRMRDGNFGDSKILQGGIIELRLHFGSGYRVYYGKIGKRIVLLLCGGEKGSQQRDIKKALKYWKDYKEE